MDDSPGAARVAAWATDLCLLHICEPQQRVLPSAVSVWLTPRQSPRTRGSEISRTTEGDSFVLGSPASVRSWPAASATSSGATPDPTLAPAAAVAGPRGRSLGAGAVRLGRGLLGDWQARNRNVTVPHTVDKVSEAGNLENFRRIADATSAPYAGRYPFLDTDVYKTLEGVAYELARPDRPLSSEVRDFYETA